jgi:hypothetical protein
LFYLWRERGKESAYFRFFTCVWEYICVAELLRGM